MKLELLIIVTYYVIQTFSSIKMFIKVLLAFALLIFFAQVLAFLTRLDCKEYLERRAFRCEDDGVRQFLSIYGQTHNCPEGTACNYLYIPVGSTCSPCIETKLLCGENMFTCLNETSFKMGITEFNCPGNYICNRDLKTTCKPCLEPSFWGR